MEEQCYWIEVNFPFFDFWGASFKFWDKVKRTAKKLYKKLEFFIFEIAGKRRIREPT